ncbi:MAG: hypothetical protein HKN22_00015, partial [Bacteroidia bacterium]|nr:hypothetical protein [Bacteroidia bacterium]
SILVISLLFIPSEFGSWSLAFRKPLVVLLLLLLTLLNFKRNNLNIFLDTPTVALTVFVLLHFLSAFWAVHVSLVWLKSMNWLTLLLLYLNVRNINLSEFEVNTWKNILSTLLLINVCVVLIVAGNFMFSTEGAVQLSTSSIKKFREFTIFNNNFTSSVFLLTLPFLLLIIARKAQALHILLCFIIFFLIFLLNSRAVIGGSIFLTLLFIYHLREVKFRFRYILGFIAICLFAFSLVVVLVSDLGTYFQALNPLDLLDKNSGNERLTLWVRSLSLFSESPIWGIGSGNWLTEYLKYGISDLPNYKRYIHAHNLLFETCAELGLFGFSLLLILFFHPIYRIFKTGSNDLITITLFLSIIAYIIVSSYYGIAYDRNGRFSGLQYSWIILLGLLQSKIGTNGRSIQLKHISVVLAVVCLAWSIFIVNQDKLFANYRKEISKNNIDTAIYYLNKIYIEDIYEFRVNNHLLAILAPQIWRKGEKTSAINTMETAVERSANEYLSWMHLGNMYRASHQFEKAVDAYNRSLFLNPRWWDSALGLAIASKSINDTKNYAKAMKIYEEELDPYIARFNNSDIEYPEEHYLNKYWKRLLMIKHEFDSLANR